MSSLIKIGAVSYLNTKPLLYGIEGSPALGDVEVVLDYPANLAAALKNGGIDLALLPVAAIPMIPNARIVSDYCIGADGDVASVCIFSQVPIEEIETVYLDYQSRTSVRLARVLLERYWKKKVVFKDATLHYIDYINGTTAGVIIGDRALQQRHNFEFVYDLAGAWKDFTSLPFVFAAWISNKQLPDNFLEAFNAANSVGLMALDKVVKAHPFPYFDLMEYYTQCIQYRLDDEKRKGLALFLEMIDEG